MDDRGMTMEMGMPGHAPAAPAQLSVAAIPAPEAPSEPPAVPVVHTQRTWPAVVALYLLAPLIAELLTGSTPPLAWNNLGGIVLTLALYGSGANLAREIVRRRGLDWANLLLLGIAYGALEEGVAFQSWFNPKWTPPPDAARFFDVNWTFVAAFTTIHMVLSITISVVIVEAIFPSLARRPWLGRKGFAAFIGWLAVVVAVLFYTYGFVNFAGKGYDHPPTSYFLAPAVVVVFLALGTLVRIPAARPNPAARPAPSLWTLRLAGFLGAFAVLINLFVLRTVVPIPLIPIALIVGVDLLSMWIVRRWSRRAGWGMRQRLALASGVMGFFIAFAPVAEFVLPSQGASKAGLTLANALALVGLILLARRVARYDATHDARDGAREEGMRHDVPARAASS